MKASVILAHPYPKSFNHAIFKTILETLNNNGIEIYAHDLYQEKFNPILSIQELGSEKSIDPLINKYAEELLESKYLIFIHPNWWGQPPAILKGYIDRIFRPPYAYDYPEDGSGFGLPIEKLKGKVGIVYNTSNTDINRENNFFGDPLEKIWKKSVFGFLGIDSYYRKMFSIIADSSEAERKNWLEDIKKEVFKLLNNHKT